jgi:hypothetical protein
MNEPLYPKKTLIKFHLISWGRPESVHIGYYQRPAKYNSRHHFLTSTPADSKMGGWWIDIDDIIEVIKLGRE